MRRAEKSSTPLRTVSAAILVQGIVGAIGGSLADLLGRKKVLVLGSGFLVAAVALLALSRIIAPQVLLVAAVLGIFASVGLTGPATRALGMESVRDESIKGRAWSLVRTSNALGCVLGPLCLGYLASLMGVPLTLTVCLALCACVFAASLMVRETLSTAADNGPHEALSEVLVERARDLKFIGRSILALALIEGLAGVIAGLNFAYLSLFVSKILGCTYAFIGLLFSLLAAVAALSEFPAGVFVDKLGTRLAIISGSMLDALAFIAFAVCSTVNPVLSPYTMLLTALASPLILTGITVGVQRGVQQRTLGTVYGALTLLFNIGGAAGPLLGGVLWSINPYSGIHWRGLSQRISCSDSRVVVVKEPLY